MKLPVNPEVVKVYVKFYGLLKKVKEEARKLLDKIKADAREYVQNSEVFMKYPLFQQGMRRWLATPGGRVWDSLRIWAPIQGFSFSAGDIPETGAGAIPRLDSSLRTPFGTPVIYGTAGSAWMR